MSFQLYTHNARMGALNLFGIEPDVFTLEMEAVGAMLATHAATALIADDERLQFQSALASRDTIGQAKGILMERYGVDDRTAFAMLVKISQESHIRLHEVGRRVAETNQPTAS